MKRLRIPFFGMLVLMSSLAFQPALWAEAPTETAFPLTLEDFIREIVHTNPLIREAHLQWLINYRKAQSEWGAFEPELVARLSRDNLKRENSSLQQRQLFSSEFAEDNKEYALGLEGKFPSGGIYRIGYSVKRIENIYTTEGAEFESFAGVSAEQPLLRGLTHGAPLASQRVAMQERYIAYHEYRRQVMDTISQAERAYWNLRIARELLNMAEDSVRIAQDLVDDCREQLEAGRMTEPDLYEAEAELETRLAVQADSEQTLRDALTQVKLLLSAGKLGEHEELEAADPLIDPLPEGWNEEQQRLESEQWALQAQPDFMIQREQLKRESLIVEYRRDQVLPALNLKGSYGLSGLDDTISRSLDKLSGSDYPSWSIGLELRVPLIMGLRQRNELQSARLNRKLAEMRLQALEFELTRSIATLSRRVTTWRSRIENAAKIVQLTRRLLEIEQARMQAGKTTIRQVYETEERLSEARKRELDVVVRYREALMDLALVRGSVLRDKGLEELINGQVVLSDPLYYQAE
jgi:outer membrane protein TolC